MTPLREYTLIVLTLVAVGAIILFAVLPDAGLPSAPRRVAVPSQPGMLASVDAAPSPSSAADPAASVVSPAYTVPAGVDPNETSYDRPHGASNPHRARYFASTRGLRP